MGRGRMEALVPSILFTPRWESQVKDWIKRFALFLIHRNGSRTIPRFNAASLDLEMNNLEKNKLLI